jgi:hypothetical protein
MLIAHKCPKCHKSDIVYNFNQEMYSCNNCDYEEDDKTFQMYMNYERYERDLEDEIENSFPYRDLFLANNTINLAIGYHITGRFKARDYCIESVLEKSQMLEEKWQLCFCGFRDIENTILSYKNLKQDKRSEKYKANLTTVDKFFNDIPMYIKNIYKK